jgi:hypothetical protein
MFNLVTYMEDISTSSELLYMLEYGLKALVFKGEDL